jgi:hypothetical protein
MTETGNELELHQMDQNHWMGLNCESTGSVTP